MRCFLSRVAFFKEIYEQLPCMVAAYIIKSRYELFFHSIVTHTYLRIFNDGILRFQSNLNGWFTYVKHLLFVNVS